MEYEKARVVAKLHSARERKRKETGKNVAGLNSLERPRPVCIPVHRFN